MAYPQMTDEEQIAAEAAAEAEAAADAKAVKVAKPKRGAKAAVAPTSSSASSVSSGSTSDKGSSVKSKMLKAIGAKIEDVLAFNPESQTLITAQGGKYQLSADGKTLRHLAGPAPTGGKKSAEDE